MTPGGYISPKSPSGDRKSSQRLKTANSSRSRNPARRIARFFVSLIVAIFAMLVAESLVSDDSEAQTYRVLLVDTAVRNRLAEEWEPTNRYQHERGYCVSYVETYAFTFQGPVVVYTLTAIRRADEERTTQSSVGRMSCPATGTPWVYLHIHPPSQCTEDIDATCVIGGAWSNQCFDSPTDRRTLERSDKPFTLIQCDAHAIVPIWRWGPVPLAEGGGPNPLSHR